MPPGPALPQQLLRDPPGYHLNKLHWNTITLDGSLPDRLVDDMIEDSYDLVVSALPRRVRDELGWSVDPHDDRHRI